MISLSNISLQNQLSITKLSMNVMLPWLNHPYPSPPFLLLLLLLLFISSFLLPPSLSDPRTTEAALFCTTATKTSKAPPPPSSVPTTNIVPNFVKEMQTLSQLISTHSFATYSLPDSPLPIYGLTQCHHDLSKTDCLLCFAATRIRLPRCLPSLSAALFLDGCFVRYDTHDFYNESVSPSLGKVACSTENKNITGLNEAERMEFVRNVDYVIGNVTRIAVKNGGFGVGSVGKVYGLAQCWDSVGRDGCRECLRKAGEAAKGCAPRKEGRGMDAGCYLRYSTSKFYNDGRESGIHHGK